MAVDNSSGDPGRDHFSRDVRPAESDARERALADPKIGKIYRYWLDKCAAGHLPARRDIDPVDLSDCLSVLMILETVDGGDDFRIRLAGSQVEEAHGRSLKGCLISELVPHGDELTVIMARLRAIVATQKPDFRSGSLAAIGRGYIAFERVALPLAEDGLRVSHLLCCYAQHAPGETAGA